MGEVTHGQNWGPKGILIKPHVPGRPMPPHSKGILVDLRASHLHAQAAAKPCAHKFSRSLSIHRIFHGYPKMQSGLSQSVAAARPAASAAHGPRPCSICGKKSAALCPFWLDLSLWLWVKQRVAPKRNPGNKKQGLKRSNFDPYSCGIYLACVQSLHRQGVLAYVRKSASSG